MSRRPILVAAAAAAMTLQVLLVACGSGGGESGPAPSESVPSESVPAGPPALASGKSDLQVEAGRYLSPVGFEPALRLDVPAGWTSVHRGADGFDLGQPDPTRDAPLLAVVVLTPPQATAVGAASDTPAQALDTAPASAGVTIPTIAIPPSDALAAAGDRFEPPPAARAAATQAWSNESAPATVQIMRASTRSAPVKAATHTSDDPIAQFASGSD